MKAISQFSPKIIKQFFLGVLLEFGPVFAFLVSFEYLHIYKATIILMISTIISTVLTYTIQKRLPYLALYVAFLTSIFGYVTLALHAPKFIQMRDTLYDLTCALTLIIGVIFSIPILKLAFHSVMPMKMRAWNRLTYLWIAFFIIIAVLNEYVRTHLSLQHWFDFKTIIVIITSLFGLTTIYFVYEKE